MKILEIVQEDKDLSAPLDSFFNDFKADKMITVPDDTKDDPAAQAAPLVQRGTELPKDHPWNLLHGAGSSDSDAKPPGKRPPSKLVTI